MSLPQQYCEASRLDSIAGKEVTPVCGYEVCDDRSQLSANVRVLIIDREDGCCQLLDIAIAHVLGEVRRWNSLEAGKQILVRNLKDAEVKVWVAVARSNIVVVIVEESDYDFDVLDVVLVQLDDTSL